VGLKYRGQKGDHKLGKVGLYSGQGTSWLNGVREGDYRF
jgi:hypothetical protein